MKKREGGFFKSIWATLIAPIIVVTVAAYLAGRLVIQISGFQLSISLTIMVTLIFLAVMVIFFFLGMGYLFFGFFNLFFRSEMPLIYRIATSLFLKPAFWIFRRFQDEKTREADKKDFEEFKAALAKYHERVDKQLAQMQNDGKEAQGQ